MQQRVTYTAKASSHLQDNKVYCIRCVNAPIDKIIALVSATNDL